MPEQLIQVLSQDAGIALGALLGSLSIVGGVVVAFAAVVMVNLRKMRQSEDINALKQAMIERGMSADEIAKVVEAKPKSRLAMAWYGPRHKCHSAA